MNDMDKLCPEEEVLASWLENGLDPAARARVSGHLADCDECRRGAALAATLPPVEGGVREADPLLLNRILHGRDRRAWLPLAAAASALVGLGWLAWPARPGTDPILPAKAPVLVAEAPPPAPALPVPEEPPAPLAVETPPKPPAPTPAPVPSPSAPDPAPPPLPAPAPVVTKPPDPLPPPPVVPASVPAPATTTDYAKIFGTVFLSDSGPGLLLSRGGAEAAAVGPVEQVGFLDALRAEQAGGCSVDGAASLTFEKGTEASVMTFKPDAAFRADLMQGPLMVDTEGGTQRWIFAHRGAQLEIRALNGRARVEPRDGALAVLLLEGSGDIVIGGAPRRGQVGREVVLSAEGRASEKRVDARKALARLLELRPKVSTAFAASFDERPDRVNPFPYALVAGRVAGGPEGGFYLMADRVEIPGSAGPVSSLTAALKPDRPFPATSGMLLRVRFRTNLSKVGLAIGRYQTDVVPKARPGAWAEAEIPLSAFTFEGTPMIPSDPVAEIRFSGDGGPRTGQLDVDGVQFLRRAR
jgi:hypothetical protein